MFHVHMVVLRLGKKAFEQFYFLRRFIQVPVNAHVRGAQQKAYAIVDQIKFDGAQFRRDIGYRAL